MLKKIVLFVLVLMFAVVPVVRGDAGPAPQPTEGKIIDIDVKGLSDGIAIGEQATLEVTVTNLTRENVHLIKMSFGIIYCSPEHDDSVLSINSNELKLAAYESITFEVTDYIDSNIDVYKSGDEYFTDIETQIRFFAGDEDDDEYYYQWDENTIPLKVNNVNDGSDLVEVEWLDDRDTIYYFKYMEDYYEDGNMIECANAEVYYKILLKNNSDTEILGVAPYSEKILHDSIYDFAFSNEIENRYTFRFNRIVLIEGKYYCIDEARTYNTQIIDAPDVETGVEIILFDNDYGVVDYRVSVTNVGNDALQNFMIMARNKYDGSTEADYSELYDLQPGKLLTLNLAGMKKMKQHICKSDIY